jgi:glucose/arabinose dehydrogenase
VLSTAGEQGLFAIAFHPNYVNNGYFYVSYTRLDMALQISRFSVTANPDTADPSSETDILSVFESQDFHNGGSLRFSPMDGYLYAGVGDDANGQKAQNPTEVYGKILRLNVGDGRVDPNARYVLGGAEARVIIQIWAMGLRNPWRIAFDELTGNMFVGDVGGSQQEEIDIIFNGVQGMNFGWPCLEGTFVRDHEPNCENHNGFVPPIHTYEHTNNRCAIILGRVERPAVQERVIFGDYCNPEIHTLSLVGTTWVDEVVGEMPAEAPFLTSFGWDNAGNLYAGTQSPAPIYNLFIP